MKDLLLDNPIIAAVHDESTLEHAINSEANIIFILQGNILNLKEIGEKIKTSNKSFFVHLDRVEGLKADESDIKFLKQQINPTGIVTTKHHLIKTAKNLGLKVVLRVFIIDSKSIKTAMHNANESKPDAIEIMPGLSKKVIAYFVDQAVFPVIAGGLIDTKEEVIEALNAGAVAVSSSNEGIWQC